MGNAANELFDQISGSLWDLLERLRSDAAGVLLELSPDPSFAASVLDGRMLTTVSLDRIVSTDPGASALRDALESLLADARVSTSPVTLHGFDPGDGQPRGLALVFVTPAPSVTLVVALSGAGPRGIALEIAALGNGAFGPATLELAAGWTVEVGGHTSSGALLEFPRGGVGRTLTVSTALAVCWTLRRNSDGREPIVFGSGSGPRIALSSVVATVTVRPTGDGTPELSFAVALPAADLSLLPGGLGALFGSTFRLPVDLAFSADPHAGVSLAGSGVRASIPYQGDLPGIELRSVELALATASNGIEFDFAVGFDCGLLGLPINFAIDGLGASFPLSLRGDRFGVNAEAVRGALPTGLGVNLSLPLLSGGGLLETTGPDAYAGALSLDLSGVAVRALGLLQLPHADEQLAFAGILALQFPPPGIQLGFGFSLNAVGGVVAINRRLDRDALHAAVSNGSASRLFFPDDPGGHAGEIVANLASIFPAAKGHLVIGPMLQIGWGGRILTMSVALVIDLPAPVQFVIVGRLAVALPDPDLPLVLLQATLVGDFELAPTPSVALIASLEGSNLAGIPLHGDLFCLLRGGDDATFVLSVGGFHPRYTRPSGVPALRRVQLDFTPPGFPGLSGETYFAITSNSVQLGARVELNDEIAGCGVQGWFEYDTLVSWDPTFSFAVQVSGAVAVQVLGDTLLGVHFDLVLEGPAPWHAHGTGSVDLFLFSVSLGFDVHWGSAPASLPAAPDLSSVLRAALTDESSWITAPPADEPAMVSLSSHVQGVHVLHPLGGLTVRQRVLPLAIDLSRFQNQPVARQRWEIVATQLAEGVPTRLGTSTMDEFVRGQFVDMSEDEKLVHPAFDRLVSGVTITPERVVAGELRVVDSAFETLLVPEISLGPTRSFVHSLAETLLLIADLQLADDLWSLGVQQRVAVLPTQPLVIATTDTFVAVPLGAPGEGFTGMQQAASAEFGAVGAAAAVQVVESWELMA